ncbi:hypothetical protein Bbelb_236310 [Branchiostoma belcheri]|nr:hypothetical protein Bbelb_236310 [Branchiostoma belcheri]
MMNEAIFPLYMSSEEHRHGNYITDKFNVNWLLPKFTGSDLNESNFWHCQQRLLTARVVKESLNSCSVRVVFVCSNNIFYHSVMTGHLVASDLFNGVAQSEAN